MLMMAGSKRRSSSYPLHLLILMMTCSIIGLASGNANSYTVVAVSINNNTGSSLMAGNTLAFTINCTVMVDCMSDPCDNDTLTILWSLNGETISGTHFTVSNPRSFNITNELDDSASMLTLLGPVNISHAGVYTCNATLESGASNTSNGTLTVQVPETPTITADNDTAVAGSSFTLSCSATPPTGLTVSSYQWTDSNGGTLSSSDSYTIDSVLVSSAGTYTCTATVSHSNEYVQIQNPAATDTATLTVTIPTPSVMVSNVATTLAGESANFTCTVTPANYDSYSSVSGIFVEVIWSQNLPSSNLTAMNPVSYTTRLDRVNTSQSGDYTCTARVFYNGAQYSPVINSNISAGATTTLMVQIPPPGVSLSSVSAAIGRPATLNCTVTVSPFVSDSDLAGLSVVSQSLTPPINNVNGPVRTGRIFTLTYNIDTVAAGNGREYTCTASVSHTDANILTSDAGSGTGTLYVSSVAVTPAAITRLDVSPYNEFSLTCNVTTIPSIAIVSDFSWSNGSQTYEGMTNGANSSTLTRNGTTAGDFTFNCTADVNVTGATGTAMPTDSANVIIKGSAPPVQPEVLSVDTNPFDATIKWRVSQVAYTPEDYVINYSVDNVTINSTGVAASTAVNSNLDFITGTNLEYSYTIAGLMSGMRYSFEIISNNTVGSNSSTNDTFYTADSPPYPPSNVELRVTSSSSLQLSWDPPTFFTGDITDYHYICIGLNDTSGYTRVDDGSSNFINGEQRVVILTGLEPFREYFCNVTAATSAGPGSPANITAVTGQAAPTGPPLYFTITSTDPSNLMLSWRPPNPPEANGIINSYYYYCTEGGSSSSLTSGNVTTNDSITITFDGIRPFTNYTCFINSGTIVGTGPYANTTGRTAEAAPSMVQDLSVSRASDTSFSIRWSAPAAPNGIITGYTVLVLHYTSRAIAGTGRVDDVRNTVATVTGLSPYIPYNITVSATTGGGVGPNASTINFTKEGTPAAVTNINIARLSDTSVNVSWAPLTLVQARGFITNYTVSLTSVNNDRRRQSGPTMTVPASQSYAVFTGLAADVPYTVLVSATTAAGSNVTSGPTVPSAVPPKSTSSPVGAILGAVFAVLAIVIIIIIVIIVLYYLRTRRIKGELTIEENTVALQEMKKGSSTDLNGKEQEEPAALTAVITEVDKERWAPIPVAQFAAHTAKLHSDRDLGFEDEYKSLKNIPQGSYTCSKLPENVSKNRFDNVFPYDASRVELTEVADKRGSDYINASFIDGYKRPKAYIAAQGPLSNTVGDFWRMVWEFQLPTIVMLTELIERGIDKCSCYWPRALNETLDVGYDLQVTLVEQQQYVDYKLKKFLLLNTSSTGGRLDVTHYHFLAWPDHGVPADKTIMLAFIRRVRQTHPSEGPPLIVHCSAGVGRTGTFITLDSMQQRLDKDEQDLNIYEFLANMRTKRVLMVQTEAQYVYIHDALSEYITCGDTSMTTKRLKIVMDELAKVSEHKSGYEKQLDLINQVCRQPSEGLLCDALSKTNSNKNRFPDKLDTLPYDMTRVRLKTASGTGDYINANHVDGYKHRGAFLATQAPMGDTVEDFWRMVWEQWSSSIVMLCNLEEKDKEVCARYWPEKVDETVTYGKMVVKLISEEKRPHYMIRKIMLSQENTYINVSAGAADHLVVTQFHYGDWSEDDKPKDETPLLKLIDQLLHNQMNTGNKAITIMCSDGVGRTGCFMCMYSALERIKIEGVADIFQYIKGARFNRPGLVQNVVQYEFCHDLVLEYINSFEAYHNF